MKEVFSLSSLVNCSLMLGRVVKVPQHPDIQHVATVKKKYRNTELLSELFTDACIQVVRVIYEAVALLQYVSQI